MRVNKYDLVLTKDKTAQLVKESGCNYNGYEKLDIPCKVYDFALNVLKSAEKQTEHVWLICMTSNCKVIGYFEVSHGSDCMSLFPIKNVIQKALFCNAAGIFIVHNHPSGDPSPSSADNKSTQNLKDICGLMDLQFLDHVITGDNDYYSYRERKWGNTNG